MTDQPATNGHAEGPADDKSTAVEIDCARTQVEFICTAVDLPLRLSRKLDNFAATSGGIFNLGLKVHARIEIQFELPDGVKAHIAEQILRDGGQQSIDLSVWDNVGEELDRFMANRLGRKLDEDR